VIVKLIAGTRTATGLKVRAVLDRNTYPAGIKVAKKAIASVQLKPASFHGDWNYTISPTGHRD
jgi:Rhodopirellula transposase DDE domain